MAKEKSSQEYLVKAKLYRFASYLFAGLGFAVFVVMYVKNIDGKWAEAFRDPMTITIFVVPFIPAVVLTFLAEKAGKKYNQMTGKGTPGK